MLLQAIRIHIGVVTGDPSSDREPNLATTPQIVAENLTHMFNGL
jgi:hypothetical protein